MHTTIFGTLPSGEEVHAYHLICGNLSATLLDYGAILASYAVGGVDIVDGFASLDGYLADGACHGAVVGRFANRIAGGRYTHKGITYQLEQNDGGVNCLHSGSSNFAKRLWRTEQLSASSVRFSIEGMDGEAGFPGSVRASVTYTLGEDGLCLHYLATSDKDTPLNLTNHVYFNLNGCGEGDLSTHTLQISADRYQPIDAHTIPTGVADVADTPFDLRTPAPLAKRLQCTHPQLAAGHGFDHNFVLTKGGHRALFGYTLPLAAVAKAAGRTLTVYTDQAGVQLYTANFRVTTHPLKNGTLGRRQAAFCLETQCPPDSPNHGEGILAAGAQYETVTVFGLE